MTTTLEVPLAIVCPDWCTVGGETHAEELWDWGGECLHWSEDRPVEDPTGHRSPLVPPRPHEPVTVQLSTSTRPDGTESESPMVHVGIQELSIAQALALADRLRSVVEQYRAEGGVE